MCGIAGVISLGGLAAPRDLDVTAMVAAQAHRGPDDCGVWSDDCCILGHRRLSIIDLSEAGRQPLANDAGSVLITYNGEIYNYQELRAELSALGFRFRTRTDTEAIVHAYERWGPECVKRLHGMFAFGLWDRSRRRLLLARDRVGKKPLFYTRCGERLLFASELHALMANPIVPRAIDLRAIDAYLSWGYVPAPATAFEGVHKLPPAHYLSVDVTAGGLIERLERYWSLSYEPKTGLDIDEAGAALREVLDRAVRARLQSDVPVGAFLSGGIDSSVIVGLMQQASSRPVATFSIGFADRDFDELPYARQVANRWGTDHHELIVQPDAAAVVPQLVQHYGEPYADSSAIPTFYLSQMTRRSVTVALAGDGGDENFAGYDRYWGLAVADRLRAFPGGTLAARIATACLPDSLNSKNRVRRAKRFLAAVPFSTSDRYIRWLQFFSEADKRDLFGEALRPLLDRERPPEWIASLFAHAPAVDLVDKVMAVDVVSYLPFDLLVKVDIASMAHGLEVRSPFLDHRVLEFAASLPVRYKLNGRTSKFLVKRTFADLLTPSLTARRKSGFGVPLGAWLRGPLRDLLRDTLLTPRSRERGLLNPAAVQRRVDDHLAGVRDHSQPLWNLLMLELWHRAFIDVARSPASAAATR